MIDQGFWKNRKVLITGHTGFKGSWLACYLNYLGSEVYGLSDSEIISENYERIDKKKTFQSEYNLNISDNNNELTKVFNQDFDFVFHLAAQGVVSTAKIKPLETLVTNIIGTFNVMNLVNENEKINGLVISTTDKVYSDTANSNLEESSLGGKEFYSASKASTEHIISAFINTISRKDLNIGVVRSGNVLGGGDGGKDRIVTDIINSLKNNEDIYLRNPGSIRPWQYILDSLNGYLMTGEYCVKNNQNEIFNLGSSENNEKKVMDLTENILKNWNSDKNIEIKQKQNSFYESEFLRIDSKKANNILGWQPLFDLEMISTAIVDWYKSDNDEITIDQIDEFHKMSS
tara:strand:- start:2354 stop:3388 length:1035 start_codon:yes stop_codon:yes gene_type:complete